MPNWFAMSTESWSLIDPPGCTTPIIPSFPAISTQSGKGKKASDAKTAPSTLNPKDFALAIACLERVYS